jgi:D-alanyl-D-alanine carboxypeptidase/D-alanyl-D-alanine-endopeptidase (penicillin-binding protein 4)
MMFRAEGRHGFLEQAAICLWACFIFSFFCPPTQAVKASGANRAEVAKIDFSKMEALLGARDAAMVASPEGTLLFSHNSDQERIPASTIKLLTALAAFHYLTTDFRFTTEFVTDNQANLKIKGQGDPLLISEVVSDIAADLAIELKGSGRRLNHLFLDNTFFAAPITVPGVSGSAEPYDAPIGALCVNFNTVNFKMVNGAFVSAEPQTPLLPMVLPGIRATGLNKGRITLSHEQDEITYYSGRLFQYFLKEAGFEFSGRVDIEPVSPDDHSVLAYHSRFTLDQIVAKMFKYSNNFIANQVFITMGVQQYGAPGTLEKGVRAAQDYAKNELGLDKVVIAEGSGISRANRISARDMLTVLDAFAPHHTLMKRNNRLFYKTGHLRGIRTQVGFYENPEKGLYPYVIFLNTPGKSAHPLVRELVRALGNAD